MVLAIHRFFFFAAVCKANSGQAFLDGYTVRA